MSTLPSCFARPTATVVTMACLSLGAPHSQAQPPIVQPGAPGEPSRLISSTEASDLAGIGFTDADVKFMQGMISHHTQATEMTQLLATRSNSDAMQRMAQRIEISQEDEIAMMQDWLRARGQAVTAPDAHHAPDWEPMPGMLTAEEMDQLDQTEAGEFDRLFLRLMITHHRGALTMVDTLLSQRGAAQDSLLFGFTSDITSDQSMEIDRMDGMLAELSPDPRVGLAAGFHDAGQAAWNMALIATRPKPDGFHDPNLPAGRPTPTEPSEEDVPEEKDTDEPARSGLLNFANTDLAFSGDLLFEGNYHGFSAYRVESPVSPQLVSSVVCPGGQGDVSVVGDLLIMSVEQTRGRLDCGLQGVAEPVSTERFRGIRIFDVSDMRLPRQVAAVQTCRGSHTHTVVTDPDDEGNIYVYGSGTSSVRPGEELDGCSGGAPLENPDTALFRIDVIEIPLTRPEEARIVSRPYVFRDSESGAVAGLWDGGDHGPGTQRTRATNQCHDITAYPEIGLAAGACSGNGILFDISDPVNPIRLDEVVDPGFAYWHSATFNNDGTKVIFTDEWGGGGRARCRASDPRDWGADAIFDIVDGKMQFRSHYKLPAPQTEQENCVAHNGSLVPVPGRDIFVQAWYQGGISVIDFTDSSNPVEIAFFDRGPLDPDEIILAGYWSAYWYRGFIYGTEIARGLDVLELLPSEYLSQDEIAAASLVAPESFNAQQQRRIDWSPRPVIGRAYLDQLGRSNAIAAERRQALSDLLDRTDQVLVDGAEDAALAGQLDAAAAALERDSPGAATANQRRLRALSESLTNLAERLR
ncbi:MAG: DUF305 domain-containing protein [bacterium]